MKMIDMQALGSLLSRKRDLNEDEILKRRNELEKQRNQQQNESLRLISIMQNPLSERTEADTQSFLQMYGGLSFFKEYISEGRKGPTRLAFQKGDVKTYFKNEFITKKGDRNNSFKMILEGQVGLYLEIPEKKDVKKQLVLIRKMLPGDVIEIGTLIDSAEYVMTTQALTDKVQLLVMSQQTFSVSYQNYETEKYESDLNFLKGVPFFTDWPKRNLIALQMCISRFTVTKSQVIYQEGQNSHALFIVKRGEFGLYKKRAMWQKSDNITNGEKPSARGDQLESIMKKYEDQQTTLSGKKIGEFLSDSQPISRDPTHQTSSQQSIVISDTEGGRTVLQGLSRLDAAKKITQFIKGSGVEMNSDLMQTFSVFDSFGEKELLNQQCRQQSVVCTSQSGELIQIKSRHFFVLAQESSVLKYSIMTKMMVDTKKQEIAQLRQNLSFLNENELFILDSHLDNISKTSVISSQSVQALPSAKSSLMQDNSQSYKARPYHTSSLKNLTQDMSNFHINKLQYFPPPQMAHLQIQAARKQERKQSERLPTDSTQTAGSGSIQDNAEVVSVAPRRYTAFERPVVQSLVRDSSVVLPPIPQSNANMTNLYALSNPQSNKDSSSSSSATVKNNSKIALKDSSKFSPVVFLSTRNFAPIPEEQKSFSSMQRILDKKRASAALYDEKSSPPHNLHQTQQHQSSVVQSFMTKYPERHSSTDVRMRKSFNLGVTSPMQTAAKQAMGQISPFTLQNKYRINSTNINNYHHHTKEGLPSMEFSSRPFVNSINYSSFQIDS